VRAQENYNLGIFLMEKKEKYLWMEMDSYTEADIDGTS
jgi:hypothetical protein